MEVAKIPEHWEIACQRIGKTWMDRSTWLITWRSSGRTSSLLPTTLILNRFPLRSLLCSEHFVSTSEFNASSSDSYSLTVSQHNSLSSADFMAFILFDIKWVPSSRVRFVVSRSYFSGRSKRHPAYRELISLTNTCVALTTSLLHGFFKCSTVTLSKTC